MQYVLVIAGFVLLIKGADWLVESAKKIAFSLGVSAFVVGMSVVALGTSMPEAAIGVLSGISKTNDISLGDVLGSCIANIALILGVGALIMPVVVDPKAIKVDIPISFGTQAVLLAMMLIGAAITRAYGIILLIMFALYCLYLARKAKKESGLFREELGGSEGKEAEDNKVTVKTILLLLLGLAGLIGGAKLVVDNGVEIARQFGMSEALIGVTVVALGTSLPELITTIVASVRKHADIAIGNIIGSNIINITLVLGLTVTINPIAVNPGAIITAVAMLAVTLLLFLLALPRKRLGRFSGVVLLAVYAGFITYSIMDALSGSH